MKVAKIIDMLFWRALFSIICITSYATLDEGRGQLTTECVQSWRFLLLLFTSSIHLFTSYWINNCVLFGVVQYTLCTWQNLSKAPSAKEVPRWRILCASLTDACFHCSTVVLRLGWRHDDVNACVMSLDLHYSVEINDKSTLVLAGSCSSLSSRAAESIKSRESNSV